MKKLLFLCALVFSVSAQAQGLTSPVPLPLPDQRAAMPPISQNSQTAPDETPRIYQAACPALLGGLVSGKMLPPIDEGACGLQSPLLVRSVFVRGQKVSLTQEITTNCQMATALAHWVGQVSDYTQSIFNAPVTQMMIGTSYMCRARNNQPGADQSEHGFANALDVTGFVIGDGRKVGLPQHWDMQTPEGRSMRFAHDAACGQFTTVLGPEANALHADHLHLDLGCHGKSCTYRLCQ